MSIDSLLELLERDAQAEVDRLTTEAEQRAREILSRSDALIQRRRAEALGRLEEAGRRTVSRRTAAAARQYRESSLQERARLLERIFADAEAALRTASAERYPALLPRLLRATLRYLEATPAVLHCRPEIAAQVSAFCAGHSEVSVRPSAEAAAGILGESTDGAVVVDNTLPALLRRRRAELAIALAAQLEAT